MGYGFYYIDGRPAGYGVQATCDKRGCETEIDRGMGWLCGETPHDPYSDEPGCGRYFCSEHLGWVGERGGCSHRQQKAWGRTLACMAVDENLPEARQVVCLYRVGHEGLHAFDLEDD